MKALLLTAAAVVAVSAMAVSARAEGPRASSEHNWPGMTDPNAVTGYAYPVYQVPSQPAAARQFTWREGYDHGGKWHGHWTLMQ